MLYDAALQQKLQVICRKFPLQRQTDRNAEPIRTDVEQVSSSGMPLAFMIRDIGRLDGGKGEGVNPIAEIYSRIPRALRAMPYAVAIPVLAEIAQHAVEIQLGMYASGGRARRQLRRCA